MRGHSRNEARSKALLIRGSGLESRWKTFRFSIVEELVDISFVLLDVSRRFLVGC